MSNDLQIKLPANNWRPRRYQLPLWKYLENGGKRACCVWHRRAGKDENCLHWAAVAAHQRVGNYWHMLPEASQARKAIWDAINPHTGKRRIDEAFPHELRETTRENEMLIRFKIGSTWQVVGSDNFNSLVGSPPIGVVFSEFSLCNPSSWAYLRPILRENGGWAFFIYTPRGNNHGKKLYQSARKEPDWFGQILTVDETHVFSPEDLASELRELQDLYGEEQGKSFFEQEYYCSFDAAILGAIYAPTIRKIERQGRIAVVQYDPKLPVHTAWDLGFDDSTAIWFWQITFGEIRLIDYFEASGQDTPYYCDILKKKPYVYGKHWVPHDAANELMAAGGRSIVQQAQDCGIRMNVVPATSQQNSIEAARATLQRCWFDEEKCEKGLNALRSYQYEWDDDKRTFKQKPRHDWSSHASDAFEIIGQVWQTPKSEIPKPEPKFLHNMTFNDLINAPQRNRSERI